MSHQKQQRTRIEDLSADGNELIELSEEVLMMVGGGGGYGVCDEFTVYDCTSTGEQCGGDTDTCSD